VPRERRGEMAVSFPTKVSARSTRMGCCSATSCRIYCAVAVFLQRHGGTEVICLFSAGDSFFLRQVEIYIESPRMKRAKSAYFSVISRINVTTAALLTFASSFPHALRGFTLMVLALPNTYLSTVLWGKRLFYFRR